MNDIQPKRERFAPEVLLEKLKEQLPQIHEHFIRDRDWVWYCGPSLQSDATTRSILKALCFRWADKGHPIAESSLIGTWGCSCLRPTKNQRRGGGKAHKPREVETEDSNPISDLASLGL